MTWIPGLLGSLIIMAGMSTLVRVRWLEERLNRRRPRRRLVPTGPASIAEGPTGGEAHDDYLSGVARAEDLDDDSGLNVRTWAISKERESYLDRRGRSYLYAVAGGTVTVGAAVLLSGQDTPGLPYEALWRTLAVAFIAVGVLTVVYAAVPYLSARSAYRQRRLATASAQVDLAITQACRKNEGRVLQTGQLFELNRRQLDEYQLVTRKQQRSAFLLAQAASVVAFAVLVAGISIALSAEAEVDKYLTTGLTALGSLLSGFLAATFFSSAKDANEQMNRYYLEPQRTGRLLAAERIVTQIEPDGASRAEMVTAVLNWEMPGADGSANGTHPQPTSPG